MKKLFLLLLVLVTIGSISKGKGVFLKELHNYNHEILNGGYQRNSNSDYFLLKTYIISGTLYVTINGCSVAIGVQVSFDWNGDHNSSPTNVNVILTSISIDCSGGIQSYSLRISSFYFNSGLERVENVVLDGNDPNGSRDYLDIVNDPQLAIEVANFATDQINEAKETQ